MAADNFWSSLTLGSTFDYPPDEEVRGYKVSKTIALEILLVAVPETCIVQNGPTCREMYYSRRRQGVDWPDGLAVVSGLGLTHPELLAIGRPPKFVVYVVYIKGEYRWGVRSYY